MKVRTFAEHDICTWVSTMYPGMDIQVEFTGSHEAVLTDVNGERRRVVCRNGEVYLEDV